MIYFDIILQYNIIIFSDEKNKNSSSPYRGRPFCAIDFPVRAALNALCWYNVIATISYLAIYYYLVIYFQVTVTARRRVKYILYTSAEVAVNNNNNNSLPPISWSYIIIYLIRHEGRRPFYRTRDALQCARVSSRNNIIYFNMRYCCSPSFLRPVSRSLFYPVNLACPSSLGGNHYVTLYPLGTRV